MIVLGLIRHGVTEWNIEGRTQGSNDVPLNDQGVKMSHQLARQLQNEGWDAIYTSPMKRAKQTAQIIHNYMPMLPFDVDCNLREIQEGNMEGTTQAERIERWGDDWKQHIRGVESKKSVHLRIQSFLDGVQRHGGQKILTVTHGSFIQAFLTMLNINPHPSVVVENNSLTVIELSTTVSCKIFNDLSIE